MMIRVVIGAAAVAALAACQPTAPEDSNFGVGFDQTFDAQRANRDGQLAGTVPAAPGVTSTPLGGDAALAADTTRVLAQTDPNGAAANSGVAPVIASPTNPPPAVVNAAGISRENNFDAVSGQRSIEADAARVASNRAQYQVVQPQALPSRTGASGPNIVVYALATNHPVGTRRYNRIGFNKQAKFQRNCAREGSADQAQLKFLTLGGPEKDKLGLDPDGDGYACRWDPTPYRQASARPQG